MFSMVNQVELATSMLITELAFTGMRRIDKDDDGNCDFWEFTEMLAWGLFDLIEMTEGSDG